MPVLVDPTTKKVLVDPDTKKVLVDSFACDGCTEVSYDITMTADGTCASGIAISTLTTGHVAGKQKFNLESSLGTAVYCDGGGAEIDNGNGQVLLTCGGYSRIENMFVSTLLVKVLTAGDIEGIPFAAGDWAWLIGSITYDNGPLGTCGGCSGTFVSPTVIPVMPDVTNTYTRVVGGITTVLTLVFTVAHTGCDPNPCANVTLSCDQISALKQKCGFTCASGYEYCGGSSACPPGYYLTVTPSYSFRDLPFAPYCSSCTWCYTGYPTSIENHLDDSGNCTGAETVGCSTSTFINCDSCDGMTPPPCCNADPACTDTYTCPPSGPVRSCCAGTLITVSDDTCYTFSSEFTTAMLIAFALAALPAYDGVYDDDCEAFKLLESFDTNNQNEDRYSLARFKPKFSIPLALGADLVICYNIYQGGVYTPKTVTIPAGSTFVIGDEVMEPTPNKQTAVITDIKCC